MRIAVTGSAGTIGTPLVAELRRRGDEVWGIDLAHSHDPQTIRADVGDYRQVRRAIAEIRPQVVYHLAAEFGRINGEHYYEQVHRTNITGTKNVLEAQHEFPFRLVFASSSEVYGEAESDAIPESYPRTHPQPQLTNDYALSKWMNERQIENAAARYGTESMILRFFNAYGPGEHYSPYRSVVCLFAYRLLTGQPIDVFEGYRRVFMYVGDFIPTLANAADHFRAGETINVGGVEFVAVAEMADMLLDLTGADRSLVRYLPQDAHNVVSKSPDIAKARHMLHHDPRTTLAEGLPLTVEWLRKTYEIGG